MKHNQDDIEGGKKILQDWSYRDGKKADDKICKCMCLGIKNFC